MAAYSADNLSLRDDNGCWLLCQIKSWKQCDIHHSIRNDPSRRRCPHAFEIRCGSVAVPGEGFPAAICKLAGVSFPKIKIVVDISLVAIAAALGYIYFHEWLWRVVGVGTLFAMIYVGWVVKLVARHPGWFDTVLTCRTGFRRYLYGLAGYIRRF